MRDLRLLLRAHRGLAALVIALALLMKITVPVGMMVSMERTVLTVAVCTDASGVAQTRQIVLPVEADAERQHDQHGKNQRACGFGALGVAALAGAEAALLATAIAFVLALGHAPAPPLRLARSPRQRPPLRGPPARTTA